MTPPAIKLTGLAIAFSLVASSLIGSAAFVPPARAETQARPAQPFNLAALSRDVSSHDALSPDADYVLPGEGTRMLIDTRVQGPPRSIEAPGTFQVDVVPITTSRGTPTITRATSERIIQHASAAFEAMSGGTVKFVLRTVHEPKASAEDITSPMDLDGLFTPRLAADAGFAGLIVVGVVVPSSAIGFAGIAVLGGSSVLMNTEWSEGNRSVVSTLVHEIGHNLSLGHSGAATCSKPAAYTACEIQEYGDNSDVMGSFTAALVTNPPHLRMSAWHLSRLGFLPASAVQEVSVPGEFTLMPAYGGTGTRLLTVPVYNAAGYAIEYRPATGPDALLSQTRLTIPGTNSYYVNRPSHGVQIRVLQRNDNPERTLLPVSTSGPAVSVLPSPATSIQGLQAGEQVTLPDGSLVRVISADPSAGARVSITIPPDTTKPTLGFANLGWAWSDEDEVEITSNSWQPIHLRSYDIEDDRRIASIVLEVNGNEVARDDAPQRGTQIEYTPKQVGTFKVRALVRDLAGNETVLERTISSRRYQHPRVTAYLRAGVPASTSLDIWYPAWKGWTFTVSNLSAGRLDAPRRSGSWTYVRIRGLKPGQSVSVRLTARDKFGQTDGGQTLRGRTRTR